MIRTLPRTRPRKHVLHSAALLGLGNGHRSRHDCLLLMSDQEWQLWRETGGDPRIEARYRRLQKQLATEHTEITEKIEEEAA